MKTDKKRSKCCNAEILIGGNGETHFYVCEKCNKSCDIKTIKL